MKVLFAIISCHKNFERRQAQRDTWLPNMKSDYRYFLGKGDSELKEDEVQLDVPDDYDSLPYKVQAVFKWALEREYDYILKLDDDVYLFPERILGSDFHKYPYVGRLNSWRCPTNPKAFISGFAYWLDAKSAKLIVEAQPDPMNTAEDRWVGGVLGRQGIEGHSDPLYKVMSTLPRQQWSNILRQDIGALCQFEPVEMNHVHGLITGTILPLPMTRPPRGVSPRGHNSKLFRIRRR